MHLIVPHRISINKFAFQCFEGKLLQGKFSCSTVPKEFFYLICTGSTERLLSSSAPQVSELGPLFFHGSSVNGTILANERIKNGHIKWLSLKQCLPKPVHSTIKFRIYLSYIRPYLLYKSSEVALNVTNLIQLEKFQSRITDRMCCKSN